MQRRQLLQAGLAGLALQPLQEALALGLPTTGFAANAPELAPLRGLAGQDLEARDLHVEGRLPPALAGVYYRNGPGLMERAGHRYRHWFDGDGLVQAWRFEGGRVRHSARFVKTRKFQAESEAGRFLLPAFGTAIKPEIPVIGSDSLSVANTSVMLQDGRLYALWEGGSAHELDPQTLATRGPKAWLPELAGMPFSAHPKVEPDGMCWNFGTSGKLLALYQISARGQLLRHAVVPLPMPAAMVHDFVVTERYLVFLLAPIALDREELQAGSSMLDAMRWRGRDATRVLLIEKADFERRRVLEMPAAMVFHFGNGWDDGRQLQLDYVEARPLPAVNAELHSLMRGERPSQPQPSTPRFLRIELASGRISLHARDEAVEFPVVDPRVVARRYRHVYYPTAMDTGARWGFNGLLHLDLESGRRERFCFGPEVVVEEHVLVPRPGRREEGRGWLLGLCYDMRRQRSFASVFDAEALSAGPLAKVWLPYWVSYGFHGKFYAA